MLGLVWKSRLVLTLILSSSLLATTSCGSSPYITEDSWDHYINGARFNMDSPTMSKDGDILAYASPCSGRGDIYILRRGIDAPIRLTNSDDFESSPFITANGDWIVYLSERDGRRHIFIMKSDGSLREQLTSGDVVDTPLHLSSNGRHLIFNRSSPVGTARTANAYVLQLLEKSHKPFREGEIAVFSPDADFVVYSEQNTLWRLTLGERHDRHQLKATGFPIGMSKDRRYLFFGRQQSHSGWNGDYVICAWDFNADDERVLAKGHSVALFGSNDDNLLFYEGFDCNLFTVSHDGLQPCAIECAVGSKTFPRVVPDGRGAIFAFGPKGGRPQCDVMYLKFSNLRVTTLASINCADTRVEWPTR